MNAQRMCLLFAPLAALAVAAACSSGGSRSRTAVIAKIASVSFNDEDADGTVDGGETLTVTFNTAVSVSGTVAVGDLAVAGGTAPTLGTTSLFLVVAGPASTQITLFLGANPALTVAGTATTLALAAGQTAIVDSSGTALSDTTAVDIGPPAAVSPTLRAALYTDVDASGTVTQGDTVRMLFDRPIQFTSATPDPTAANAFTLAGSTTPSLGTGATITGQSLAASVPTIEAVVTLGATPSLTVGTTTLNVGSAPVVEDRSGGLRDAAATANGGQGTNASAATAVKIVGAGDVATATGPLNVARQFHTATVLADGKVLVVGGTGLDAGGQTTVALKSAEIYDPASGSFRLLPHTMALERVGHAATLLPADANGVRKVLITGGERTFSPATPLNSAEVFDPTTLRFATVASTMKSARSRHAAALVTGLTVDAVAAKARVFLIGGIGTGNTVLATIEAYDPEANAFEEVLKVSGTPTTLNTGTARHSHFVEVLRTTVPQVVFGGGTGTVPGQNGNALAGVQVLFPAGTAGTGDIRTAATVQAAAGALTARYAAATALARRCRTNDAILVAGGIDTVAPILNVYADRHTGANGLAPVDRYGAAAAAVGVVTQPGAQLAAVQAGTAAARMNGNRVAVIGGFDYRAGQLAALATIRLLDDTGAATTASTATGALSTARAYHTATRLADGTVLVTGGRSNDAGATTLATVLSTSEVYRPVARFALADAVYCDLDSSATVNAGDTLVLAFSGDVTVNGTMVAADFTQGGGLNIGATATFAAGPDADQVTITLGGAGIAVTPGTSTIAVATTTRFRDAFGAATPVTTALTVHN
ncbi:MAG: hypothetical protein HY722_13270 [Planctomycetes bacterium]|nr:hypothetical protein [Planctomycetota bacterium]